MRTIFERMLAAVSRVVIGLWADSSQNDILVKLPEKYTLLKHFFTMKLW
ncbi:hypothetical protein Enr13x_61650 [Stieleria neptunia]|uniref:Uncharacterized protein n=1 Tax=Stieleria neptunia TaxID=2527979 RepID=A0A518HZI2_9BACT|nr:hypothetical protein [Stieleria neptunia]QDV46256.1 hypothetical protein Enr13x_61650 [Stieleria neptunia]